MTVPIYITAAILAVVVAYISDKVGKRSPFIVGFLCLMLVGFIMYVLPNMLSIMGRSLTGNPQGYLHVEPKGGLRRRVHRGLRHLPGFPGCYFMVEQ
jgi:hypothetical protein